MKFRAPRLQMHNGGQGTKRTIWETSADFSNPARLDFSSLCSCLAHVLMLCCVIAILGMCRGINYHPITAPLITGP